MQVQFHKYQGTGNDFIILDNRNNKYAALSNDQIRRLCDRRLGIGADGLMFFNEKKGYDFEMKYHNADGKESSMCGNGGRCIVKFAYQLGIHPSEYKFIAVDGEHMAEIGAVGFAYYLFRRLLEYLRSRIFKHRLVKTFDVLKYVFVLQELIVNIDLRPPALKKIGILLV